MTTKKKDKKAFTRSHHPRVICASDQRGVDRAKVRYRVMEDAVFPQTREVFYSVEEYDEAGHYHHIAARCFNRAMAREICRVLNNRRASR